MSRRPEVRLVVAWLMRRTDATMLQKTDSRDDTDAIVEAMKKPTGK